MQYTAYDPKNVFPLIVAVCTCNNFPICRGIQISGHLTLHIFLTFARILAFWLLASSNTALNYSSITKASIVDWLIWVNQGLKEFWFSVFITFSLIYVITKYIKHKRIICKPRKESCGTWNYFNKHLSFSVIILYCWSVLFFIWFGWQKKKRKIFL